MRERLASRFGFLMLAAGSAVGLGNVWRFPYVAGRNGGAAFVLVYLAFLALLGFPLLCVELGIGRGANRSLPAALAALAPPRLSKPWGRTGAVLASGCFVLMIYYTDVAGWLLRYTADYARLSPPGDPAAAFASLASERGVSAAFTACAVAGATAVCTAGVVKGVERATKFMMVSLLALLGVLAVKSLTLDGAAQGLAFYLRPDWSRFMEHPVSAVFDAMGQAFFTLSLGIGSMTICGSYTGKDDSLVKEAAIIIAIDTFVALLSGLVVFPACAAFGVAYGEGPGLIFVALPKVFAQMACGALWGFLFFLFLAFAAFTTVVAVFECLIAGLMDSLGMRRLPASLLVGAAVCALSMPCVLFDGVMEWEDFAVSQLWLPAGALCQALFVSSSSLGWGWDAFAAEVSAGRGWAMPRWMRRHVAFAVPVLVLAVLLGGLWMRFCGGEM